MSIFKPTSIISLFLIIINYSCSNTDKERISRATLIEQAPALTPEEFIQHTQLEEGFELQIVASEPQIVAPIAMMFDEENRIWALEMTGYMRNAEGDGEDEPTGKVIILEDQNGDGYYETRKVFLDSLRLPRSLTFYDKGLLVAEPPYLWYYDIIDDQPHNKVLVDSAYTAGGNVEHQANGLFRAIDNWIYNAASSKRYKKTDEGWLIERNHARGQWGLAQDDIGRLYYNNNSQNILGDYFLPGLGANSPSLRKVKGFNEKIVDDNRTFPSRPTPGVNRGYETSVLDDSLRLKNFTAACGPVIYNGDLFAKEYYQNAFLAEPAANLIKRNILEFDGNQVGGRQAYTEREFLASDDERFRPVSLYNGPDGAMYIVDMYRGIIQHKLFLTKYLKDEINSRNLDQEVNGGRIYRVVPKGSKVKQQVLSKSPQELVDNLGNSNGWVREKAQQLLVDMKPLEVVDKLKTKLVNPSSLQEFIHVLWTLEGMEALSSSEVMQLIVKEQTQEKLLQLYSVLEGIDQQAEQAKFVEKTLLLTADSLVAPYIAFKSYLFDGLNKEIANQVKKQLLVKFPQSQTIAHALISNAYKNEDVLFNQMKQAGVPSTALIFGEIRKLQENVKAAGVVDKEKVLRSKYGRGVSVFRTTCQPCHGADGNGIEFLAPPLNNSEWVTGDKETLIGIVLHGLKGPITVNNKLYKAPEVSGEMPGLMNSPELVDADLALLLSYIRKNWNNEASDVTLDDINQVKAKLKDRKTPFTEQELKNR